MGNEPLRVQTMSGATIDLLIYEWPCEGILADGVGTA